MSRDLPSDPLLLLRESAEVSPPSGVEERVATRLAASIAAGVGTGAPGALASLPSAGASPPSSGGSIGVLAERFLRWSLVPLAVGVALGAGGQALRGGGELHPRTAVPTGGPAPTVTSAPSSEAEPGRGPEPELRAEAQAVPAVPSAGMKSALAAERSVLDRARKHLAADEPAKALVILEQHARRFPRGELSEEREAMWINVLVLLNRGTEAKARGDAFAARFPNSLMGSSVRAALLRAAPRRLEDAE